MEGIINKRIENLPSCSLKNLLTCLKDKNYKRAQKIIKNEPNQKIKEDFQELVSHVRSVNSIKTGVKYIKEDRRYIYEDMHLDKHPVKVIFYSKDIEKLTEFLAGRYFKLFVNRLDNEQQYINAVQHRVFNYVKCISSATPYWLNCMVGIPVQNLDLFRKIRMGVETKHLYYLDFSKGYMEYALKMAIQDFNRFLAERSNVLYFPGFKYHTILYRFKIEEPIDISIKGNRLRFGVEEEFKYRFEWEQQFLSELPEIEKWNVYMNSFSNYFMYRINPKLEEKFTVTISHGKFSESSDLFNIMLFPIYYSTAEFLRKQNRTNIYTGLYNGKYFQTWYTTSSGVYTSPPAYWEKKSLIYLIDKRFHDYLTGMPYPAYNEYNITDEKREEIKQWLKRENKYRVSLMREKEFKKFLQGLRTWQKLMPPVKGFPKSRIVQPYEEMEIDE